MNAKNHQKNTCLESQRTSIWRILAWGSIFVLLSSACAVKVNTLYDQTAPFEDYRTFCWFDNCQFTIDGPVYLQKDSATVEFFKSAVVSALEDKGFTYDPNNPDFLLHMHIVVEEERGVITSPYSAGDADDWQGVLVIEDWVDQPYVYLKGSVIIDIADAETSQMVWRSDAVRYMDINPDITENELKRGVKQALKKFPPK